MKSFRAMSRTVDDTILMKCSVIPFGLRVCSLSSPSFTVREGCYIVITNEVPTWLLSRLINCLYLEILSIQLALLSATPFMPLFLVLCATADIWAKSFAASRHTYGLIQLTSRLVELSRIWCLTCEQMDSFLLFFTSFINETPVYITF